MGYFKTVAIDITEAVAEEVKKGFESFDEMKEVFEEIAAEYDVTFSDVWSIYRDGDLNL